MGQRPLFVTVEPLLGNRFAARGRAVIGIDLAPDMLALARQEAARQGADVRFEDGDTERPLFSEATFDLLVSRHVLWSLSDRDGAVAEWLRILRPGGRVGVFDGDWNGDEPTR